MALQLAKKLSLCRFIEGAVQQVMFEEWALQIRGAILMKCTLTALTIAATMFASGAFAADPDDLQKLRDAYLKGAFLSGAALSYTTYMLGAILCNTTIPDGSIIYSGC